MSRQPFSATLENQPGLVLIELHGEINAFAEEELLAAFQQAEDQNPPTVVLNFADVEYINSTGIALIVGVMARARKARRRMVVYGLSDHYREIFRITRLSEFLSIVPDRESALAFAAQSERGG